MKMIGIFEIKTKLSQICDTVAATGESVLVTKRGKPFVRIEPLASYGESRSAVWDLRDKAAPYEAGEQDLEIPARRVDPLYAPFSSEDEEAHADY
ncbi:MAG: type II toxin-antitoxin system Phd/YefM family antitoxin [Spirochaetia bacterium]